MLTEWDELIKKLQDVATEAHKDIKAFMQKYDVKFDEISHAKLAEYMTDTAHGKMTREQMRELIEGEVKCHTKS